MRARKLVKTHLLQITCMYNGVNSFDFESRREAIRHACAQFALDYANRIVSCTYTYTRAFHFLAFAMRGIFCNFTRRDALLISSARVSSLSRRCAERILPYLEYIYIAKWFIVVRRDVSRGLHARNKERKKSYSLITRPRLARLAPSAVKLLTYRRSYIFFSIFFL